MKILFTNHSLDALAGTESVIIDLAKEFKLRGHEVGVYSPKIGLASLILNEFNIPTWDNINEVQIQPDVIHGHHQAAVIAATRFPTTPVVYVCHGVEPWVETPPNIPNIVIWIAVSNLTREKILEAIPWAQNIEIIPNCFDSLKFIKKEIPRTEKPKKVALFGNHWKKLSLRTFKIKSACRFSGIHQIDLIGFGSKSQTSNPENLLPNYDLVFAVGRCATEAMASGCKVILADSHGIGGMVTPQEFDNLSRMNFALEATRKERLSISAVTREIKKYSSFDSNEVAYLAHEKLSLKNIANHWEKIYSSARTAKIPSEHELLSRLPEHLEFLNKRIIKMRPPKI